MEWSHDVTARRLARLRSAVGALMVLLFVAALGTRCSSERLPPSKGGTGGVVIVTERMGGRGMGGVGTGGTPGSACQPQTAPPCAYPSGGSGGAITCGDVVFNATCVNGAWTCPNGILESECWCFGPNRGGCVCTRSGWACPTDAAVDHGSDATGGADGAPDAGLVACNSTVSCGAGFSYCYSSINVGGTGGAGSPPPPPPSYSCQPFPAACGAQPTCDCLCQNICPKGFNQCFCYGSPPTRLDCQRGQ